MSFLVLDGLTKRYGEHAAVDGISLVGRRGRVRVAARALGLRQDDHAADDRRLRRADGGRASRSTGATCSRCRPAKRGLGIVFQNYALFPHMTVADNVAFGLEMRNVGTRRARAAGGRDAGAGRARRLCRASPGATVGRPAAARGAGPRAGDPARPAAARRAAVEPRRQAARGDAGRTAPHPARRRHHHADGHARPGRGAGAVRPRRRDERRAASSRRTARSLPTSTRAPASSATSSARPICSRSIASTPPALTVGSLTLPLPVGESAAVRAGDRILVRPEKIAFGEPGPAALPARVTNRVFQGNHWLSNCTPRSATRW